MRKKPKKKQKSQGKIPWYKNPRNMVPIIVAAIGAMGLVIPQSMGLISQSVGLMCNGPQLSTIQGKVTDTNGVPIAAAIVEIEGLSATTDASGEYMISDVSIGTKTITFLITGAEDVKRTVKIEKGGAVKIIDVVLPPVVTSDIEAIPTIQQGDLIPFGNPFDMIVVVRNHGNQPAQNLHLYGRAEPSGYIALLECDHPYSALAPAGIDITIGDLFPGAKDEIHMKLIAQDQTGLFGETFKYEFTYNYYGADLEKYAGDTIFSVGSYIPAAPPPE